ncbi:hypothetical protein [Nocardia sp. NBC_00403]|uniref:hypothetical protein n=1 Tax=Nocardia sp. NBC_00403 TaxID=2975990 RepID=UPI002E1BB23C
MTAVRVLLLLAGLWLGWYGLSLLLDLSTPDLLSVAVWFTGGILLHDAVFAPLCAAVGIAARRILPRAWWAAGACGAVCTVALVLIAAPVLRRGHAMPDNPTVLDRDYMAGFIVAVVIVWALVVLAEIIRRRIDKGTPR